MKKVQGKQNKKNSGSERRKPENVVVQISGEKNV